MHCAVFDCEFSENSSVRFRKTIKYYPFPKDAALLQKWIAFCDRDDEINVRESWICKNHFLPMDFERNLQFEMGFLSRNPFKLLPTAVPSIRSINNGTKDLTKALLEGGNQKTTKRASEIDPISIDNVRVESVIHAADDSSCEESVLHEEEIDLRNIPKKSNVDKTAQLRPLQALRKEIIRLKRENLAFRKTARRHVVEVNNLTRSLKKSEFHRSLIEKNLRLMFTEGQMKKLSRGPECRINWTEEDIEKATELYSVSRKVYEMLQKRNYPLPTVTTIFRWIQKGKIEVVNENPKKPGRKRYKNYEIASSSYEIDHPYNSSSEHPHEIHINDEFISEFLAFNENTNVILYEDDEIVEVSDMNT